MRSPFLTLRKCFWASGFLTPAQTVPPGGGTTEFEETISVSPGAAPGTYTCEVKFLLNGADAGPEYTQTVTVIVPQESLPGRMTGGGRIEGSERVTHGFELHCNPSELPNNLQVNWGKGNKFHLDMLTEVNCTDDPTIMPNPPEAGFDTMTGSGTGQCNGAPATIEFRFTDAGEPGSDDTAAVSISGGCSLTSSGTIQGNHQAHND